MMEEHILFLSEDEVFSLLEPADVIDAVENVFLAMETPSIKTGEVGFIGVDNDSKNFYMSFPVMIQGLGVAGCKWFSGYNQSKPGYPFSHGNLMILSDLDTGRALAVMGAGNLTAMRSAGGHCAVAAKYLTKKSPRKIAVIGAGKQARAGIRSLLYLFPGIEELAVYSQPYEAAVALSSVFSNQEKLKVNNTARNAVKNADLILLATTSQEIIIPANWCEPGMTIVTVSAFRDLDPAAAERADKWIIGSIEEDGKQILESPTRRHGYPLSKGMIYAQLTQVLNKEKAGRENDEEIIIFTHMGTGAFDLACAKKVYDKALKQGKGTFLHLENY